VTGVLLAAGFAVILVGAILFTNAVEWLGHRLDLGSGAVGSVLAAVATALPESVIPVVAIVGGKEESGDVAIGAIVGAPFMLATVALALAPSRWGSRSRRGSWKGRRCSRAASRWPAAPSPSGAPPPSPIDAPGDRALGRALRDLRRRSRPELTRGARLVYGRRDSNPRPPA
jgi:hypothetical protein